jgi:hypothetical protein
LDKRMNCMQNCGKLFAGNASQPAGMNANI